MRGYASVGALVLIGGTATSALAQAPAPEAPAATSAAITPAVPAADAGEPLPAQIKDPLEGFNRVVWKVNRGLDTVIVKPVSTVYRTVIPRPARRGITHVFANLSEPWSFVNGLLQGKPKRAFNSLGRFVVNSTIGVAGLGDPASKMGMRPTPEDFGQTLYRWGVKSSAYLVLPVLGPSTIRDGIGTGVGWFADPYRIAIKESGLTRTQRYGINALEVVSARADLADSGGDTFLKTSLDPYAAARSAYLQRRQAALLDQDDNTVTAPAGANGAAAPGGGSGDAALDAAVADIKAQQAAEGGAAPDSTTPDAATPAPDANTPGSATPVGAAPEAPAPATSPAAEPTTPPQ